MCSSYSYITAMELVQLYITAMECKLINCNCKKSVLKRSAMVQKKVGLISTFFLNRFDQFCFAHVLK